jgi:hypothetical protein
MMNRQMDRIAGTAQSIRGSTDRAGGLVTGAHDEPADGPDRRDGTVAAHANGRRYEAVAINGSSLR